MQNGSDDHVSAHSATLSHWSLDSSYRAAEMVQSDRESNYIEITSNVAIPISEVQLQFSRSGGPGGQNVNRRETQVELLFDIRNSPSLTEEQRTRLLQRLASRVDGEGILHIVARSQRSQLRNRRDALERFVQLLRKGLQRSGRRIATKPSQRSREKRLTQKRRRSEKKTRRRSVPIDRE
jgi:ribosome-associated protein